VKTKNKGKEGVKNPGLRVHLGGEAKKPGIVAERFETMALQKKKGKNAAKGEGRWRRLWEVEDGLWWKEVVAELKGNWDADVVERTIHGRWCWL